MTRAKNPLSRRNLLGLVSTASLGPGLLSADAAAQPRPPQDNGKSRSGARTFNIRDFGAKGDGQTLDTQAVQAAIDACSNDKGGRVLVPAGTFLIGTVEMKSNVTLHISAEGTLMGSTHSGDYHPADRIPLKGDTTLRDGNVAMIYAVDAEDITIEGPGIIDGQGVQFPSLRRHLPPKFASGGEDRPHHLLFYRCKNVRIRDVFLFACAYQSVRIIQSRYVWCDGIRIYSRVNRNNDGFHFVSCEDVHVSNCDVRCQDDACAMFGSCRNITVTNCAFSTRWAVFRFGGGNPANITISNCVVYETYGCPIKMQFGPESQAQNILFSNIVMDNVTGPISIGLSNVPRQDAVVTEPYPKGFLRNISFNGIRARVVAEAKQYPDIPFQQDYRPGEIRQCIAFNCISDSFIEGVTLNDVHVVYEGGGTAGEAERIIPKIVGEYFERGTPPAYGLYARRVRGLTLNNVRFETEKPDLRPAVVFDHVTDASLAGFAAQGNSKAKSLLRFIETSDVLLTARVLTPVPVFLRVEGASSQGITIDGGDLAKAALPTEFKASAKKGAVAKLRT